jgi:hypothetical protein
MRSMFRAGLVGLVVVGSADAQACLGRPAFGSNSQQIGATVLVAPAFKGYGVELASGTVSQPFGIARAQRSTPNESSPTIDSHAHAFNATIGHQIGIARDKKVQICPTIAYTWQQSSSEAVQFSSSATIHTVGLGGAIGTTLTMSSGVHVVPFLSAQYTRAWGSAKGTPAPVSRYSPSYTPTSFARRQNGSRIEIGPNGGQNAFFGASVQGKTGLSVLGGVQAQLGVGSVQPSYRFSVVVPIGS